MKINVKKRVVKPPVQLRSFENSPYPIISLYLGGWTSKPPTSEQLISRARSAFTSRLKPYERRVFQSDLEKIVEYLRDKFDSRKTQGVAFFAARDHLWQAIPLSFSTPDICLLSFSPYLQPFDSCHRQTCHYTIVLFDREKAEFVVVDDCKIKRVDFFENGEVPSKFKTKKEWLGRDDKVSRQIKSKLHKHLQFIAKKLNRFLGKNQSNKLILGSHKGMFTEFEELLDRNLASQVVAEVPVDLKKDLDQTVRKCLEAIK